MIYIKKIIYFIITSSFTLVALLTLALFLYAAFFFKPPSVERKVEIPSHIQSKKKPSKKIVIVDTPKIDTPKIEKAIKNSLFATIGNKAITQWDISNEMKILLILSDQSFNEDIKIQLQTSAIQSTINRTIKKIEVEKHNSLTFLKADLDNELKKMADKLNMDRDTFKNTFIANGIPFSNIIDKIQIDLLWNSLIFEIYKDRLTINLGEIDEQLKSIQQKKVIKEYLLSEIIFKPVSKDKLESTIKEIKNKIKIEGFEKVAKNLSISNTALEGGNLGWVNENVISKKFKSKIIITPIGNISEPTILPEGIVFFKVRDTRKSKQFTNLEDAKNKLVNFEKMKILRMYSKSYYENLKKSISIYYY